MAGSALNSKPMSIKEIAAKAQDFEFNPFIAVKYWLRSADTLLREVRLCFCREATKPLTLKQAEIYENEDNDQQAYLLLMRYATLITEKLPLHPGLRDPENRPGWKAAQKNMINVFATLEALKPRIDARYSVWERSIERRKQAGSELGTDGSHHSRSRSELAASDPAIAGNTATLYAAENSELAVKLAHNEIRRRDAAKRGTRKTGVSEQEEQERRTAGLWDDWEASLSKKGTQDDDEMRRNMESSRRRMDGSHEIVPDGTRNKLTKTRPPIPVRSNQTDYRYPSIQKSIPFRYEDEPQSISRPISSSSSQFPPKPPKERFPDPVYSPEPPALPSKTPEPQVPVRPRPQSSGPSYTFRPSAYLENGKPLRTVFLPPTLRNEFLKHAESNTRRNLETCGMLCGTVISNALFIQRVVIPEQESTSDTCETINESAFFDYCESEDLLVLGWIHTHPTQTCFMSSRDLHTHCAYQMMMPESIAIVCAPSKNPS